MTDTQKLLLRDTEPIENINNMADQSLDDIIRSIFDSTDSSNWKPSEKVPLVIKEIERLKSEMKSYINESDCDILAIVNESKELCAESKGLIDEMESCQDEIEKQTMAEVLKSIENHDHLAKELERVNFIINIICDIVNCGRYVKDFEECKKAQSYARAVECINDLLQILEYPAEGYNTLTMYANLKTTALLIWENLLVDLMALWDQMFSWSIKSNGKKNTITIAIKMDDSNPTLDVIYALSISKQLPLKVVEFSTFLLKELLNPIINQDCTVYAETDELMTVTINNKVSNKPPYDVVLANLRILFHFLSNKLNKDFYGGQTVMKLIGKEICVEFSDILVRDCLIETIPNNIIELQTYDRITSQIQEFQQFLAIQKIFPNQNFSVLHYVNNIDVLFAERSSQHFLETARTIMLKDLSATMSIGVETIPEDNVVDTNVADESSEQALKILDKAIPKSLFYFPRCMISKTAQELLDLVYSMMEQAVQCSDVVCKRLYITTRLVFELYDAVVPYHHENFLQTIPQYVALFHNNCLYLAHNLQLLGDKWLALMEGREVEYPIGFLDLVPKLRDLGYKQLTLHMQQQRKQILDNIRSSDLNCIVVKDVLGDNAEQAIRQCLRQLHLLKNVWIGVFPLNVFTRLMATLVTMFVDELIHRVCSVEDISAEMATQLTTIYTIVVNKAPHLLQKLSDIEEHVKSWIKLQELILVLGGSLKDIEKRWNDGAGPLAVHFRTEELRSLIKALFQNTQFRANLLSKIK